MSYYLLCAVEVAPCPEVSQIVGSIDYQALGITGASLSTAVGLGAAMIFAFALVPLIARAIIKMINDI